MDFGVVPGAKTRVSVHHSLFHTTQPVAHHISTHYLSLLWANQRRGGVSKGPFYAMGYLRHWPQRRRLFHFISPYCGVLLDTPNQIE